ncbi:MAG TPA: alpha-glucosidase [Oculatellaceae cyanobacterium]
MKRNFAPEFRRGFSHYLVAVLIGLSIGGHSTRAAASDKQPALPEVKAAVKPKPKPKPTSNSGKPAAGKKVPLTNSLVVNAKCTGVDPWWKHAVIYEIYPRSFKDSDGDGIGDLNGITSELDYLQKLGIDAIWLTPCYPSPQVDFGYDISDYRAIAKEYGTMADFERLVAEAKKRNIRIIMDLVMNHTSDKHQWFLESKSSKTNPKRDWYIWRDGKNGSPPNNWSSVFGHSAWKLDPTTNQYYYHFFYPEQPDLNYRNKEVEKAMLDIASFWLDKGVAGFRLDAIGTLFENPEMPDNPEFESTNAFGDKYQEHKYTTDLPEVHDVLRDLRKVLNSYPGDRVLIGETGGDVKRLSTMFGQDDEIQLPMNFAFTDSGKLNAKYFSEQILAWDRNPAKGWPLYVLSNHDGPRQFTKFGDGLHNDRIAKLLATFLLTTRGTPLLYYGEEIGMENYDPRRVEDVQDPIGKIGWPKEKGRDGERTPMQWSDSLNAGFSPHRPWLPVALNYPTHNVQYEQRDKSSILHFYENLITLRRTRQALLHGSYEPVNANNESVVAYIRKSGKDRVLVLMNMSSKDAKTAVDRKANRITGTKSKVILSNVTGTTTAINLQALTLKPWQALLIQL